MKLSKKNKSLVWLVLFFLLAGVAPAFSESEKEKDIKKLLEVSGILRQLSYMQDTFMNSVSIMISGTFPKVPDEFWKEFNQLVGEKEMNELIARVIPVYDKHMSHETVKKLVEMFETPFWEEWKKKMPEISREAGVVGSQWGREISQSAEFNQKVEGLIKKYELEKLNQKNKKAGTD
ncbi:MAG: DUF2059 domain-containing protein [Nitrospinae bacterium]|nr:DUF2059 domain-containing protein [Nitrospinota bacterium]MZH13415.1 DUF2059 domain-containing protein [Nitrospinota bacterium]